MTVAQNKTATKPAVESGREAPAVQITKNLHFRDEVYKIPLKPTVKVVRLLEANKPADAIDALLGPEQSEEFWRLHEEEPYAGIMDEFWNRSVTEAAGGNS